MPLITVPSADSEISVVTFGAPVANALNDHEDRITAIEGADWTDYSPSTGSNVLQASTTNPTQGSSTYLAQFVYLNSNMVQVRIRIDINTGGGWNAGSGNWRFMLPPQYPTMSVNSSKTLTGAVFINDSGTALKIGVVYGDSNTTYVTVFYSSGASATTLGSGGPGTPWGTGDVVTFTILYEPA